MKEKQVCTAVLLGPIKHDDNMAGESRWTWTSMAEGKGEYEREMTVVSA